MTKFVYRDPDNTLGRQQIMRPPFRASVQGPWRSGTLARPGSSSVGAIESILFIRSPGSSDAGDTWKFFGGRVGSMSAVNSPHIHTPQRRRRVTRFDEVDAVLDRFRCSVQAASLAKAINADCLGEDLHPTNTHPDHLYESLAVEKCCTWPRKACVPWIKG